MGVQCLCGVKLLTTVLFLRLISAGRLRATLGSNILKLRRTIGKQYLSFWISCCSLSAICVCYFNHQALMAHYKQMRKRRVLVVLNRRVINKGSPNSLKNWDRRRTKFMDEEAYC